MRFLGRTTLALTLLAAVLVPAQLAAADSPDDGQKLLAKRSHGQAAINALGSNVDEAAAVNDLTTSEFKHALTEDPSLWVGRDGRMFYVDSAEEAAEDAAPEVQAASAALEETFELHSLPGSNHTIYLDFGSVTLASNSWWVTSAGMTPQSFGGYSQDGDPAFNDTEKTFIQQVWSIVAEKYSAFDVDVTTENPGANGYNRTSGGDLTWGDRVAITSDDAALEQACGDCAGRALIDVFDTVDSGQYEPAWVFTDLLGTATLTANAAAHEIGHTLGLSHDGNASTSYYGGHNHWVPLMGITNSKAVAQFSKGEYAGANNLENDLTIIAGNGAPLRGDDAGNTVGTATALAPAASYEVDGIIANAADKDVYAVSRTCDTDLTATATGVGTGQTLDIKLSVYNAAGALVGADDVASSNAGAVATGMNAAYTAVDAGAGTYYVEVDGVGSGGLGNVPNPSTGYTDYASIGQYTLAITGCTAGTNPPSAPQNLTASPSLRSTNGSVSWTTPASTGDGAITGYKVSGLPGGTVTLGSGARSAGSSSLVPGTTYPVSVVATNVHGDSSAATVNLKVPTWAPTAAPVVSPIVSGKDVSATWGTVANPGGSTITGWSVTLRKGTTIVNAAALPISPRSYSYGALAPGSYTLSVTVMADAEDTAGRTPGTATFSIAADKPSAPKIGTPSFGIKGGAITAIARWAAPTSDGGSPITSYKVVAYKLTAANNISKAYYSNLLSPASRSYKWTTLPAGRYKFRVVAKNVAGTSPFSAYSTNVLAQ